MVLEAACGEQVDARNKAVRLTANKLFSERHLQPPIQAFAQQMLSRLIIKAEISDSTSGLPLSVAASKQQYESEEDGSRFSELYCALCTKNPKLLRELLQVYGGAAPGCQKAIEGVASGCFLPQLQFAARGKSSMCLVGLGFHVFSVCHALLAYLALPIIRISAFTLLTAKKLSIHIFSVNYFEIVTRVAIP